MLKDDKMGFVLLIVALVVAVLGCAKVVLSGSVDVLILGVALVILALVFDMWVRG